MNTSRRGIRPLSILFLLSCILFSSCVATPRTETGALREQPKPSVRPVELEKKIHALVNRERTRRGLSALAWDAALAGVARGHSRDMAKRGYFSHDSPEGRDFSFRYGQAGYSCGVRVGSVIHTGAENIALNNLYDKVTIVNGKKYFGWNSEDEITKSTIEGWMNSSGHRKNILTPHWGREGIGVYIGPDDRVYVTQNFC